MPYKLVITAGPSLDETTHSCVHVNSENHIPINSEKFVGKIAVRVAGFQGLAPEGRKPIAQSKYFDTVTDATFSIEASGRWLTRCMRNIQILIRPLTRSYRLLSNRGADS